jgi:hypothetical protein
MDGCECCCVLRCLCNPMLEVSVSFPGLQKVNVTERNRQYVETNKQPNFSFTASSKLRVDIDYRGKEVRTVATHIAVALSRSFENLLGGQCRTKVVHTLFRKKCYLRCSQLRSQSHDCPDIALLELT